jgi:menaquinone-specific isochorismate synthase
MPSPSSSSARPALAPGLTVPRVEIGGTPAEVGYGPFERLASPRANETCFYLNDFALSDPQPWHYPHGSWELHESAAATAGAEPSVTWDSEMDRAEFEAVFAEVMASIRRRDVIKAVPVSMARGRYDGDFARRMWATLHGRARAARGHRYFWGDATQGGAGVTPEFLFRVDGRRLTTMALAGTVDAAHADDLESRPKLAREHDIVVDELRRRLATLGTVGSGPREVVPLGSMLHLRTTLHVDLASEPVGETYNELVRLLHPTPALGISPRHAENLATLQNWRERMATPTRFGAPLGAVWPGGALFLVAIRGVFWEGDRVLLPAGCGVVAGSELEAEWAEVQLKQAWVRHALAL